MRKIIRVLIAGLLLFSGCKPQELSLIKNLGSRVRVSTTDGFVYAELAREEEQIFISDEKRYAWYEKGQINSSQGDYSGKLLHGPYVAYYATNKQLKEKGSYAYGLKKGKWLLWQADGQLKETQQWRRGQKNGKTIMYDSLGREKQKIKYHNGVVVERKKGSGLFTRLKRIFKGKKAGIDKKPRTEKKPAKGKETPKPAVK
uniref:toxin-antitoxin system YwqK family antitoxin n=1 Tax=Pedobacter schmidteae TaxID=2201271 RepID=UPI000EAE92E6|nr:hypothetical protein [Pedobacter schmidteae]